MGRIFHKKGTSILFCAAILVLILLVCMLLVTLTQWSSLNSKMEHLQTLIDNVQQGNAELQELKDYLQTDEYVRKWAEEHGRLSQDDISWLEKNGL